MDNLKKLGGYFAEMVENSNTLGALWKNIPLGHQAFELMKEGLPLRVKGELTPYTRIVLLNKMMGCMPERDCARFISKVQEYQMGLFCLICNEDLPEDMEIDEYEGTPEKYVREYGENEHKQSMKRIQDYLNPGIAMEEWCNKYDARLKFDPVERTQEWEDCIYDVEQKCERILEGERKGMGFCYSYWSAKKAVLAKHGIQWNSPSVMNPGVMFD